MNMLRKIFNRIWRLGDLQLPIGEPWFEVGWPGSQWRNRFWGWQWILRPVRWQGWATTVGFVAWFIGSVMVFVHMHWQIGGWLLYAWLMPTVGLWAGLVGAKSKNITPYDDVS